MLVRRNHIGNAAYVRSHDGSSASQRLMDHVGPPFAGCGQAQDIGCGHQLRQRFRGNLAEETDAILHSQLRHQMAQGFFVNSLRAGPAGNQQGCVDVLHSKFMQSAHHAMMSFALDQGAYR